ncbi:MAG: hypothetical protein K2G32_07465 [Oscillospiraceae bacterium]|nr:hypothetical protein [Oscillospiraceae bacterium]
MADNKAKILVLVEGEKTDVRLMERLFNIYGIEKSHQIVSYNTNIYMLYKEMFRDNAPENIDLLQMLKERERDPQKKIIFDQHYSDILLIFDLDPQDRYFSPESISKMMEYFVESSDMGKLYINYPMVEAFYHIKSIPDIEFNSRYATMEELRNHKYKMRVCEESPYRSYDNLDKSKCNMLIHQNIEKGYVLCGDTSKEVIVPDSDEILSSQLNLIEKEQKVAVLCTCIYYIVEYNPKFID